MFIVASYALYGNESFILITLCDGLERLVKIICPVMIITTQTLCTGCLGHKSKHALSISKDITFIYCNFCSNVLTLGESVVHCALCLGTPGSNKNIYYNKYRHMSLIRPLC